MNVDGYYNSLLSFIDKAVDEGFIAPSARQIIVSAQTAHELMSKLEVDRDRLFSTALGAPPRDLSRASTTAHSRGN